MFRSGPLVLHEAALFTDLYQLTMAAVYFREGLRGQATFSLFTRRLPPGRGFLVAAGLEDALEYLRALQFSSEALTRLEELDRFEPGFLAHLEGLRFTGDVRAAEEGTALFPDEPLLEVTAPIIEAQLVETALLNLLHGQTVIAGKAARVVLAARGRAVAEFGMRRSHGVDAGLKSARCAYLAGCDSTSDVLAGVTYGVPLAGTMAHSYVTAYGDELEAFRAYARAFPGNAILLLDTYDTLEAARKAVVVARELADRGERLTGVRLDSGDLLHLSRGVRGILDEAGFPDVRILASGGLDEHDIDRLLEAGAPIDAFGVGTRLNVSADAPSLDLVYKLVSYDGREVLKLSEGKETWVGPKAVYRLADGDLLAAADEEPPAGGGESLLRPVMREGGLLRAHPPLAELRARCAAQLGGLPSGVRRLERPDVWPVRPSETLRRRQAAAKARVARAPGPGSSGSG